MRLHPFRALRPRPDVASQVSSPPYDVMSREEARQMSEHSRGSFLQVIRAEIALPESVDPHDISVYELAARRLAALEDEGWLVRDATPSLYLYRLEWRGVAQVGFVGCAEVDDYDAGRIKRHEFTRPDKEDDRTQHVDTIGANTGPVFLTCRASEALLTLQQRLMVQAPETSFRSDDVDHAVWPIRNPEDLSQIAAALGLPK